MGSTALLRWLVTFLIVWQEGVCALKCVQCTSEMSSGCMSEPGKPIPCDESMKYCITIREYLRNDSRSIFNEAGGHVPPTEDEASASFLYRRSLVFMARSCVKFFGGNNCDEGIKDGQLRTVCKAYCRSDGCNTGWTIHAGPFTLGMVSLLLLNASL